MIDRKISVHLQDFPDVSFLNSEEELVKNMDLVRSICSLTLSLRDNKNLRVRLPLKSLTVIGKNSGRILPFKEIIADEVNVKEVKIAEEISSFAELKLQINFKKIGAKYGSKMKEITAAMKSGDWKKVVENDVVKIDIAGVLLIEDEFELKLDVKSYDEEKFSIAALPSSDYIVSLAIELDKNLEDEGIARDIVRAIQQNRKSADLNVSDRIKLQLFSSDLRILEVAQTFNDYICEQVLADEIICLKQQIERGVNLNSELRIFENKLDEAELTVKIIL